MRLRMAARLLRGPLAAISVMHSTAWARRKLTLWPEGAS